MYENEVKPIEGATFVQNSTKMSKPVQAIDEKRLSNNPFTASLVIPVNPRQDTKITVKDENGKEGPYTVYMDGVKSTKVFHNPKAGDQALSMSAGGMRMYLYIIHKMDSAKDWIRITPENYAIKTKKLAMKTYKRDINELIDNKYICLSPYKYVYYINPAVMFCGSRIQKYPDNLQIGKAWKGTDQSAPKKGSKVWAEQNEPKGEPVT